MGADKKAMITGATGFIGANLCLRLARDGWKVHALVRSIIKAERLIAHPNVSFFQGDVQNRDAVAAAMSGCTDVYHLAALARLWHPDPEAFHEVNVEATIAVAETAVKEGVNRFVLTSSAGTIGPSNVEPVDEETNSTLPPTTEYEATKRKAEIELLDLDRSGMKMVIVNPTRVFGPGQMSQSNAVTRLIDQYRKGRWRFLPGDGESIGNYVYVDDVVEGHLLAMEKGKDGERYILGGENVSYRRFFDLVAEEVGKSYTLIKVPVHLMMAIARFEKYRSKLLKQEPVITPGFARKYLFNWDTDHSKAEKELGYNPIGLGEGIKRTLNWLRDKS